MESRFFIINILKKIYERCQEYKSLPDKNLASSFEKQIAFVCGALERNINKITQQQQQDVLNETKRLHSIVQLEKILNHNMYRINRNNKNVEEMVILACGTILGQTAYCEDKSLETLKQLETVVNAAGTVTKEEKEMVVRAMGMRSGHWFKCPNGHYYCIGECGGAMQVSKCNECGASIGGTSHRLLDNNRHAGEMDGSKFAAYSEEYNNMANFRFM
ncbi:unnamed protein product [Leptidea sinapis]|uniref:RZ-type domain-containing protein n=1 Tax=Leptidea sinapis TaxID=189913 RepID=A0A5E4Q4A7_9NEOP|nr:unnamed protein product [Leptidea sinapis]